jgi:hypothetical protein
MKKISVVITLLMIHVLIFNSCKQQNQVSKEDTLTSNKFDIWMNKQLQNAGKEDIIHFSIICEHELSTGDKEEIGKTGAIINTFAGTIITVQATKEQINQLADLTFIKYFKGSKPVKLRNMNLPKEDIK